MVRRCNLAIAVRGPCDCPKSLQFTYDFFCHLKSCVFCTISAHIRAVPVRGLSNATYDMSTGYRLTMFSNLYNFSLNKIVEAAAPVNLYENLTAASCLRT